jgi:hypothetical protein
MDPNLWNLENKRLQDVYQSANLSSAGSFLSIQGNLAAIAGNLSTGRSILDAGIAQQDITYNIISTEQQRLQQKKSSVDTAYESTQRMVELNNNYQKRYWDYTKIIVVWVGVLALYLIMNLLTQYVPAIPSILTDILVLIALIAAAIYSFIIYNNLRNYNLMRYGEINLDAPVISDDQANAVDLKNALTTDIIPGFTTNSSELACLKNNLFYNTVGGVTTCYRTCSNADGQQFGCCISGGTTSVNLQQGFQNIQANGTYEFNDYSTV